MADSTLFIAQILPYQIAFHEAGHKFKRKHGYKKKNEVGKNPKRNPGKLIKVLFYNIGQLTV